MATEKTQSEKIIALLETISLQLASIDTGLKRQQASAPVAQAPKTTVEPTQEGADEATFYILAEGRVWKTGKGAFYFAKVDHDHSETRWSLGIALDKTNGEWLHKGDVVAVRGRRETKTYGTETQFQVFADSVRLVSRAGDRQPSQPYVSHEASEGVSIGGNTPVEDTEDVPF